MAAALDLLASGPAVVLSIDDEPVAATIGRVAGCGLIVEAIAVTRSLRGSGRGRRLLDELAGQGDSRWIVAETDLDGVGFYRACGFSVATLGEKYPGVKRFRCTRATSEPSASAEVGDAR